jgi:hypothetical protein
VYFEEQVRPTYKKNHEIKSRQFDFSTATLKMKLLLWLREDLDELQDNESFTLNAWEHLVVDPDEKSGVND